MNFKRRLRNVCLFLFGGWLILFALTTTMAYVQGGIIPAHYLVLMYLVVVLLVFFAYVVLYWGD